MGPISFSVYINISSGNCMKFQTGLNSYKTENKKKKKAFRNYSLKSITWQTSISVPPEILRVPLVLVSPVENRSPILLKGLAFAFLEYIRSCNSEYSPFLNSYLIKFLVKNSNFPIYFTYLFLFIYFSPIIVNIVSLLDIGSTYSNIFIRTLICKHLIK